MAFSPAFLEELRARVGLADLIGRRVRLIKKGREHSGLCPFHKEKTPSFVVNEAKGFYHCFGCGAHGGAIDFVMQTEGLQLNAAVEKLASEFGLIQPKQATATARSLSTADLIRKMESLQDLLINEATGGRANADEYKQLRAALMADARVSSKLPAFVKRSRYLYQFWELIKHSYPTYAERRKFIWDSLTPIFEFLEQGAQSAIDEPTSTTLKLLDSAYVCDLWTRATRRRDDDPEGAITSARALIEAVCKHVLEHEGLEYSHDADLPKLYRLTADALNIAPSKHTEEAFKAILGACQTVVNQLATLRNRIGDAHGQGRRPIKPKSRHAALAVNLAGTMAAFLVATWEEKKATSRNVA